MSLVERSCIVSLSQRVHYQKFHYYESDIDAAIVAIRLGNE